MVPRRGGWHDDPIGDVSSLTEDLKAAQVDRRRAVFLSFFIRFEDRARWEDAAHAAEASNWVVTAYSQAQGHVLRLSRNVRLTVERVESLRTTVQAFARDKGGVWESLAVEGADTATRWDEIADKYMPRPAPASAAPAASSSADSGVVIPKQRSAESTDTKEQIA